MKRFLLLFAVTGSFFVNAVFAQERTISGTVTAEDNGSAVPGVNVILKGTTIGTVTDIDGKYKLAVPAEGGTLVFSFIGLATEEVEIGGRSVIDMVMTAEIKELSEIIVTAIGISRDEKALGYSIQQVQGDEITKAREANIVNAMQGRIAGAIITNTSGAVGASSRVVLRGANSISGNNQPLFVVDGIPISNRLFGGNPTSGDGGGGYGDVNYGNGAADINPDDVESISVLKGPNAAALYGSRASNGVILITTKSGKGKKGVGVSISNTMTFESPLKTPDWQNKYGQGSGGEFEFVDGQGGGTNDGVDESWGPQLNIGLMIPQFNSPWVDQNDHSLGKQPTPWVSNPDNWDNFYETGVTSTTNVSLTGGDDKTSFRGSYTYFDQKGLEPNTFYKRNNLSVSGSSDLTDKLNLSAVANYVNASSDNIPGYGYSAQNVMQQQTWFGRQVDVAALKDYTNSTLGHPFSDIGLIPEGIGGTKFNWNYNYHNNPYFTLYENLNTLDRSRIFGNAKVAYEFTDWLSLFVRSGLDYYSNTNTQRLAAGDVDNGYGQYSERVEIFKEQNTDFLLAFHKKIGTELDLSLNAGGNRMDQNFQVSSSSADELAIPGVYTISNSRVAIVASSDHQTKRINSLYFFGSLGWNNSLFLDFTGRNDWSSTLPEGENSYFYPSVTLSAVLTDLLNVESDVLSFAKVRGGWAKVGSDTDPYQLFPSLSFGAPWGTISSTLGVPNDQPNDQLKPQFVTSIEVGANLRFFQDRITLDATYYSGVAENQIISVPISAASGYTSKWINAGEMTNKGIEIMLGVNPVRTTSGFTWDIDFNWAKNTNKVVELAPGIERYVLGSYWGLQVMAIPGEPYGSLYGYDFLRTPGGEIINDGGVPQQGNLSILGNYTPDWIGGMNNRFTFKGFDFNFLIDMRQGGDIYSVTTTWGRYAGVLEETLIGREGGIVGPGVKEASDGTYVANDVVVSAEEYNKAAYVNSLHYSSVFDAGFIKLREVKFGYTFSKLGNTPFRSINLSVVGRNLAILKSTAPHIDPESSFSNTNIQGLEYGQLPSARSIGFNIGLTF
ncbi:MAG TPA: SusC/RagA family TonB-linked outer membrane protein [Cyclobacteriaceae bacterium]|nr:SusC/RagA family TonB-linked outer membrane protein [Cyclobacteriaceae bacterium]